MTTFKDYVEREIAKMGFDEEYIKTNAEERHKAGLSNARISYITNIYPAEGGVKYVMAEQVPFVPRSNVFFLGIDSDAHGRGQILENHRQLKYAVIYTDKYDFAALKPDNFEIFDTKEEAKAANSWVKDAELRKMLIEAARDNIPHFKKPEKLC